jgi:fermentation-respiration switch protein FrsA (DUF1100 family)
VSPETRAWIQRHVIGDWSLKRVATGIVFVYASLCAIAFVAGDALMFRPHAAGYDDTPELVRLPVASGATVVGRFFPAARPRAVVLYSHGNAEDLGDLDQLVEPLNALGLDVFAYDYEGYGKSEGTPTEQHLYDDIDAAYRHLTEDRLIDPSRIVVYGRSIGSGPAVDLASRKPVGALVLEGAFTSVFRVATRVRMLPWDPFDNVDKLARVRCPILVLHAEHDRVVPFAHGEALFAHAPGPRSREYFARAGHADIPITERARYSEALDRFLRSAL